MEREICSLELCLVRTHCLDCQLPSDRHVVGWVRSLVRHFLGMMPCWQVAKETVGWRALNF